MFVALFGVYSRVAEDTASIQAAGLVLGYMSFPAAVRAVMGYTSVRLQVKGCLFTVPLGSVRMHELQALKV